MCVFFQRKITVVHRWFPWYVYPNLHIYMQTSNPQHPSDFPQPKCWWWIQKKKKNPIGLRMLLLKNDFCFICTHFLQKFKEYFSSCYTSYWHLVFPFLLSVVFFSSVLFFPGNQKKKKMIDVKCENEKLCHERAFYRYLAVVTTSFIYTLFHLY